MKKNTFDTSSIQEDIKRIKDLLEDIQVAKDLLKDLGVTFDIVDLKVNYEPKL